MRLLITLGLCLPFASLGGCTTAEPAAPPLFGGQGASVAAAPGEMPLPPATSSAPVAGPCGASAPPSETALIDDFEDADNKPFRAFQREGWWYTATDETAGGVVRPPPGTFSPERRDDASAGNLFALHLAAQGFTTWGVIWGTSLAWVNEGVKCPFNAERFAGIRFRAKGPGALVVKVGMPETQAKRDGGSCTKACYDMHGKLVFLNEGWQAVEVRWDKLQQGGWGAEARFDPKRILGFGFAVDPKQQPTDVWIDDLEFLPAATPAAPTALAPPG